MFLSASLAATPLAASSSGSALSGLLPLVLLVLVFFFFIIRPQRNRQRQMLEVRRSLAPGAEVQTTFGLFATVVETLENGEVVLEIAPGVHCRFVSATVARVVTPSPFAETEPTEPAGGGAGDDEGSEETTDR